jgi:hypothetical protein
VACGGLYNGYHKSSTGEICYGGAYRPGNLQALAASGSSNANVVQPKSPAAAGTSKLMIFGGQDHKTYLGCLNCSEYAADSVLNKYGRNGSEYSSDSIWNHYSQYGSQYSNEGACNPYASDPPVIVDEEGKYYGRLTLNIYHSELGMGSKLRGWLNQEVCAQ